ncbi:MAG: FHA domain-containing protein [Victivallaceae bacterium]
MKIYFLNGVRAGEKIELQGREFTLGRETDNDISLMTGGVSRYHARLTLGANDKWSVTDLQSTNGVKVNHELVNGSRELNEGDIVEIGDQSIRMGEKKDIGSEIASIIAPSPSPIIQPSPDKTVESVQKIIFQPIAEQVSKPEFVENNPPPFEIKQPKPEITPMDKTVISKSTDEESAKYVSEVLLKEKVNFFGKKEKQEKPKEAEGEQNAKKRHMSNLLFYTCVICATVIFIALFYNIQKSNEKGAKMPATNVAEKTPSPFLLFYEKEKSEKDNIFRFTLLIENNTAQFTIDDLKSQRHYSKTINPINANYLDSLKREIDNTSFMTLQPQSPGSAINNLNEIRKMVIGYDKKFNEVEVINTYAPNSFETIERAINDFSGNYGLQTIAMTPEELTKQAEESYYKAEELFLNREAKPGNLLKAILRYRITVEYLDQFSPKPPIWDKARKREQEAEEMRLQKIRDLKFEKVRLLKINDLEKIKDVLNQIMELTSEDEKDHQNARSQRISLDEHLRRRK